MPNILQHKSGPLMITCTRVSSSSKGLFGLYVGFPTPKNHVLVLLEYGGIPIQVQVRIPVHSFCAVVVWNKAKLFTVKASFNLRQIGFTAILCKCSAQPLCLYVVPEQTKFGCPHDWLTSVTMILRWVPPSFFKLQGFNPTTPSISSMINSPSTMHFFLARSCHPFYPALCHLLEPLGLGKVLPCWGHA